MNFTGGISLEREILENKAIAAAFITTERTDRGPKR